MNSKKWYYCLPMLSHLQAAQAIDKVIEKDNERLFYLGHQGIVANQAKIYPFLELRGVTYQCGWLGCWADCVFKPPD